jgi:hypothetical protein
MAAVMYMGYLMQMRMDMPMMLGTMFLPRGTAALALGAMLHLMMGAVFFVVYTALFDALSITNGIVGWSVLFGLVHGAIAGASMGVMPVMHPRMVTVGGPGGAQGVTSPGFFATSFGVMGPIAS